MTEKMNDWLGALKAQKGSTCCGHSAHHIGSDAMKLWPISHAQSTEGCPLQYPCSEALTALWIWSFGAFQLARS